MLFIAYTRLLWVKNNDKINQNIVKKIYMKEILNGRYKKTF